MKNLAIFFAVALWSLVIVQACQMQFVDEQKFDQLALEQELKLDALRFEAAGDAETAKIILDTLGMTPAETEQILQNEALELVNKFLSSQEQELGTISVSSDSTQVFEYNQ